MPELAIQVSGVSKCYQVYDKPHDRIKQAVVPRMRRAIGLDSTRYFKEFWALHDLSFEVRKGDTVGIIGRNGSGKSTLLQMICGTLTPTTGDIKVKGRVAALLELGAGFNPEFTGRENVFMSAAILGLSHEQVVERFDRIVAFADIGDFVDQPVKVYSSGMYVRLAFAVIAHVDADILVIDEALAVGDAVFVQKCMRFLRSFRERGTLLFVSHDTNSVLSFCQSAIWLDKGVMRMHSSAQETTQAYIEYCAQESYGDEVKLQALDRREIKGSISSSGRATIKTVEEVTLEMFDNIAHSDGWKSGEASIERVSLTNIDDPSRPFFYGGEHVLLRISAQVHRDMNSPIIGFFVKDSLGQSLFGEHTFTHVQPPMELKAGQAVEAEFEFYLPLLPNGDYSMTVSIAEGDPVTNTQHHWLHDAVILKVSSPTLRYGLVGIPFDRVQMQVVDTP
ncbi:ABC transporter ATP-binding protein [Xanthomonas oryzae]|uniref:ABC transporter ATP-binding protein n=1 Tax=Xanthomonas oryzae TaxID=347 RepID=UPI0006AC7A17|nr:ABC transporter ATP-binding protein [Xanthomonas oryzae]QBG90905.1 ABC transporter ATP-binding protein [Xanthomonas oryzae]QBG94861.1 ABC transporter ATP-binding protein [Xanthomonas oryzae]QBH02712.1 ABC transporter ATP-binding protein [Xanthomonas oryzae]RBH86783.1 ABC transporter ATP-binding protein [Xanthomonas oryzae pv. oryzae]